MVLFNYSTKELTAKIVYYGPGLCGKTTNLQYVHQSLPQNVKGKMLSLATKTDRTLFFDFLPIDLGEIRGMQTRVQLYTVPGQVFYNETRKLVLKGADGIVFVADSQQQMLKANVESFRNLEDNLRAHGLNLGEMPHIIQFNKRDLPKLAPIEEMNDAINKYNAPFYESVATTGVGVQDSLKAITKLVLLHLTQKFDPKAAQSPRAGRPAAPAPRPASAAPQPQPQPARGAADPTATVKIPLSDPAPGIALSSPDPVPVPPTAPTAPTAQRAAPASDETDFSFEMPETPADPATAAAGEFPAMAEPAPSPELGFELGADDPDSFYGGANLEDAFSSDSEFSDKETARAADEVFEELASGTGSIGVGPADRAPEAAFGGSLESSELDDLIGEVEDTPTLGSDSLAGYVDPAAMGSSPSGRTPSELGGSRAAVGGGASSFEVDLGADPDWGRVPESTSESGADAIEAAPAAPSAMRREMPSRDAAMPSMSGAEPFQDAAMPSPPDEMPSLDTGVPDANDLADAMSFGEDAEPEIEPMPVEVASMDSSLDTSAFDEMIEDDLVTDEPEMADPSPMAGDAAAGGEVTLTEVVEDSDLFDDPDLDVAHLTSGEERIIVVPVELGDETKGFRRFKLSLRLRLDSVD